HGTAMTRYRTDAARCQRRACPTRGKDLVCGVLVLAARPRDRRTEADHVAVGINHGPLVLSPLGVLRPMDLDPCGLPVRRDDVSVVYEQVGTRMTVFAEVLHDAEMDLDVFRDRD